MKTKEKETKDEAPVGVSRSQHGALNNLNMIMFWIRKTKLSEDQLVKLEIVTSEILNEIKPY